MSTPFEKNCPTCGRSMANNNEFCSRRCYNLDRGFPENTSVSQNTPPKEDIIEE